MKFYLYHITDLGMAIVPEEKLSSFIGEQTLEGRKFTLIEESTNEKYIHELALEHLFMNILGLGASNMEETKKTVNPIVQTEMDIEFSLN